MTDFLFGVDRAAFFLINRTLSNPVLDLLMPFLTDLNKLRLVQVAVLLFWIWLIWKGGYAGRMTAFVLVLAILFSDQLSSSIIKPLFHRLRPCHVLEGVRLLVDCGPGYSFPSSHAVNNFAGATVITHYFPRQRWGWFGFATLIALTRPYVGVHYPSDIVGGAFIGAGCGWLTAIVADYVAARWKQWRMPDAREG